MARQQNTPKNHPTFNPQQSLEKERQAYLDEEREEETRTPLSDQTSLYEQARLDALTGGSYTTWELG